MLRVKPFAKINLGLEILRKRADGYHDINTCFIPISIFDEIIIKPDQVLTVETQGRAYISQEKNLCYKAAQMLREKFGVSIGAKIQLRKNIPTGAGLGGGSSDAAFTLLTLNSLWNIKASMYELKEIAGKLGSDIPFFLMNGAAIGNGRGEILTPVQLILPFWIVVVYPKIHVSTASAYSNIVPNYNPTDYTALFAEEKVISIEMLVNNIRNDFETSVFATHPVLASIKQNLRDNGALFSMMSGSGSSIFGLFSDEHTALESAKKLSKYQSFVCRQHTFK
ncbi:MAG: 4-(cytidine 5'-diphospho)-2-C-methyl-D-erythritol kinase [Ignavibacteriae bacterium]|nr:4-(cytidine 5'-diphospho)-2-C-methyl-D-erythritol kinase [Ignavibacteriota bacterium]